MDQRLKVRPKTVKSLRQKHWQFFVALTSTIISYIWHQNHKQSKVNKLEFQVLGGIKLIRDFTSLNKQKNH